MNTSNTEALRARFNELVSWMKTAGKVAVAYSGGVDSTLVSYAAYAALGDEARVVLCQTPLIAREEVNEAVALATSLKLPLTILELDPLELEPVRMNYPDRCYYCKYHIFEQIAQKNSGYTVVDGTNFDDTFADRPGLHALVQLKVQSPLALLRITKKEVRALAHELGLPNWDKPSAPCLATRFKPYTAISLEMLSRTQKAERLVMNAGFTYVRVRDNYPEAIIEVHPDEVERLQQMLESIRNSLTPYYKVVSIAPEGYPGSTV